MRKILITLLLITSSMLYAVDCSEKQTTYDIMDCQKVEIKKADKELNKVYGILLRQSDSIGKKLLIKTQRAWIIFRDAEAKYVSDRYRGGTISGIMYGSVILDMTKVRTKELKEYSETL